MWAALGGFLTQSLHPSSIEIVLVAAAVSELRLSPADRRELLETIGLLEEELAGRNPRFAIGAEAEQFETLGKLYLVAISHARSSGWADAKRK